MENAALNNPDDDTRITRISIVVLVLGFLAISLDGFDILTISLAAPHIVIEWHITDKSVLAPVFSASLVGMLFGAPLCGLAADRLGRRIVVIACCILIGVPTFLIAFANTLTDLIILRFIAGLGIGGIAPCLISLTSEFAPKRHRATMVTIMYAGITLGSCFAAAVGTWYVPHAGWRSLFVIGGIGAVLIGVLCLFTLPESRAFLNARQRIRPIDRQRGRNLALAADLSIGEIATRGISMNIRPRRFIQELFHGRLGAITPLLWIINVSIILAVTAINNWLPTLLASMNRSATGVAAFSMVYAFGGTLGGLVLCWLIDRGKLIAMAFAFALSIPLLIGLSYSAHSDPLLFTMVFFAGFASQSIQFGINAVSAIAFPTHIRSLALGCSFAIGRVGAIIGPFLISLGLIAGMSPLRTLYILCVPLGCGMIASAILPRKWNAPETESPSSPTQQQGAVQQG